MAFDLTSFFKDPDWFHRFDEYVLAQGKKLSSPRFLSALNLEKVDDGYLLTARSDEHDAEINLCPESDSRCGFDSSCTCQFGSFCPHAAAALLRASRPNTLARLMRGGGTTPSTTQLQKEEAVVVKDDKIYKPTFHLEVAEEPARARVVQLLLQALKMKWRLIQTALKLF